MRTKTVAAGTINKANQRDIVEERITFNSDGLTLAGSIGLPDGVPDGEKRPALIVLHGFGSTQHASNVRLPCALFNRLGYATMRFDMRGCGDSDGDRGRLICMEQVSDTRNALTYLQTFPCVDASRIGIVGSSFGAAVAIYAAGSDERFAACISASGWGNGARKFKSQHSAPGAFDKFMRMLDDGKAYRERTGQPMMVSRYDIVPIPDHLRGHVVQQSIMDMPVETAQSMYDFCAEEMIGKISPRPTLLLHSAIDSVTPPEQTIRMFDRANDPCEMHLFSGTDHFMFAEKNQRVYDVVTAWLATFFPVFRC